MNNAEAIIERLRSLGVAVAAEGDSVRLEPGSRVPQDLVTELRLHKPEVLVYLWEHPEPPQESYRLKYPRDSKTSDSELAELERRVHEQGYVLLWATVLEDFVAFYKTEADRKKIPPGFVPYSEQELRELFGEGNAAPSPNGLRLIHEAKKCGGRIIGSQPEHGEEGA